MLSSQTSSVSDLTPPFFLSFVSSYLQVIKRRVKALLWLLEPAH